MKFHDTLNEKIWQIDNDNEIRPEVANKLKEIANAFIESLEIPLDAVTDCVITGSSASYNYTPYSDIDLHLKVDFDKVHEDCPVVKGYLNAIKAAFNSNHDIHIHGIPVEVYAEGINEDTVHNGLYSLWQAKWIDAPQKIPPTENDAAVNAKFKEIAEQIDQIEDSELAVELLNKVYEMRKAGLTEAGEFSTENLAFKKLRDEGYLQKLRDIKKAKVDKELSLENKNEDFFDDMNNQQKHLSNKDIRDFNFNFYEGIKKVAKEMGLAITAYVQNTNNHLKVAEAGFFTLFPDDYLISDYTTVVYTFIQDILPEYIKDMGLEPLQPEEYKIELSLTATVEEIYAKVKALLNTPKILEFINTWLIYKDSLDYIKMKAEIDKKIYQSRPNETIKLNISIDSEVLAVANENIVDALCTIQLPIADKFIDSVDVYPVTYAPELVDVQFIAKDENEKTMPVYVANGIIDTTDGKWNTFPELKYNIVHLKDRDKANYISDEFSKFVNDRTYKIEKLQEVIVDKLQDIKKKESIEIDKDVLAIISEEDLSEKPWKYFYTVGEATEITSYFNSDVGMNMPDQCTWDFGYNSKLYDTFKDCMNDMDLLYKNIEDPYNSVVLWPRDEETNDYIDIDELTEDQCIPEKHDNGDEYLLEWWCSNWETFGPEYNEKDKYVQRFIQVGRTKNY